MVPRDRLVVHFISEQLTWGDASEERGGRRKRGEMREVRVGRAGRGVSGERREGVGERERDGENK